MAFVDRHLGRFFGWYIRLVFVNDMKLLMYLCKVYMHNYVDYVGQSMNLSALYIPPAWLSVPNYIA